MDNFYQVKSGVAGAGACALVIGCICACSVLAVFVTLTAYLGIFAFNNPDQPAWYANVAGVEGLFGSAEAATAGGALTVDDVHGNFVTWFTWGFANMVTMFGTMLCAGVLGSFLPSLASCAMTLSGCAQCSGFAWWIAGMVWRLRQSGKYASGDVMPLDTTEEAWEKAITAEGSLFQVSSGNFMYTYLLITWIFIGVCCGCSIIGGILRCLCK